MDNLLNNFNFFNDFFPGTMSMSDDELVKCVESVETNVCTPLSTGSRLSICPSAMSQLTIYTTKNNRNLCLLLNNLFIS